MKEYKVIIEHNGKIEKEVETDVLIVGANTDDTVLTSIYLSGNAYDISFIIAALQIKIEYLLKKYPAVKNNLKIIKKAHALIEKEDEK